MDIATKEQHRLRLIEQTRELLALTIECRNAKEITRALDLLQTLGDHKPTEQTVTAIKTLADIDAVPTALYRHYSKTGELLYIGVSMTITGRTAQHETYAPWFREIDHIDLDWYGSRSSALRAEQQAIKAEKPTHNITYNTSRRDQRASAQEPATGTLLPTGEARHPTVSRIP